MTLHNQQLFTQGPNSGLVITNQRTTRQSLTYLKLSDGLIKVHFRSVLWLEPNYTAERANAMWKKFSQFLHPDVRPYMGGRLSARSIETCNEEQAILNRAYKMAIDWLECRRHFNGHPDDVAIAKPYFGHYLFDDQSN